jgi:hypothetical protein
MPIPKGERMKIAAASAAMPQAVDMAAPAATTDGVQGWHEVVTRMSSIMRGVGGKPGSPDAQVKQLGEMIKLQMDVCRYQVKVELVSKVSESGVASVRKLQQSQ